MNDNLENTNDHVENELPTIDENDVIRKTRKCITRSIYDQIILLYTSEKYKIAEIAENLHLDRKTVRKYIQNHQNGIDFLCSTDKMKRTIATKNNQFTEIEQTIFNFVSVNNAVTQTEIKNIVSDRNNEILSLPTISRKMKKMKLSRKILTLIPNERNTPQKIEERAIYGNDIARFCDNNLVFLDETGFNEHTRRTYGYSPINTKAYLNVPGNKNINKSLLCVIDLNGVVTYKYKSGAFRTEDFVNFINEQLLPYFSIYPNKILIMDNASFHKSTQVQDTLRRNAINFKYLPPYSPQLNPIEEFFSMIKSIFKTLRTNNRNLTIEESIRSIFSNENEYSRQCQGFYRNMRTWIERARQREPFI